MSDFLNLKHKHFGNLNYRDFHSSLPIQTLPQSKKNEKWEARVMDRLEEIAIYQFCNNLSFVDYRDMYEGRLVYQDFADVTETTQAISEIRKDSDIPAYIKHFDIIGKIANQLVGEFNNQRDTIRVDSLDAFSRAEFFEEKNKQLLEYTKKLIDLEIQAGLAKRGIDENGVEFENEEQKAQFEQFLQQQKNEIVPPEEIERRLSKDFKASIVEWAEAVLEADYTRFQMEISDTEELLDYILTGRYFKHYHVGYDYYRPETWKPETTFFSQDLNIKYPQDGEYVGQILFLSAADIIQRYGEKLPEKVQKKLYEEEFSHMQSDSVSLEESIRNGFTEVHAIPYKSYYQRDLAHTIQGALGVPMGTTYFQDDNGEIDSKTTWLQDDRHFGRLASRYSSLLRKDIQVRQDVYQVIEGYWRGFKLHGLLTLESDITQEPYQTIVSEDILKDFLDENDIKIKRTISLEEAQKNKEPNTLAWFYVPTVYQGKKISSSYSSMDEDYCFDVKEMDFIIRGDSNLFDVKLPVAGLITSSICQKIRPYQVKHNVAMNLVEQSLEKHVGSFMMFDYNFLASQYKGEIGENSAELIEAWRENIKDTGIGFYDSSVDNTGGRNPNSAIVQPMRISHVEDIRYYTDLAQFYESQALAQIGITAPRAGNPNEYMTTEGIRQGVQASYAQTERIYKQFNSAKVKERELHLRVAQYAVKNNKDITVDYINSERDRVIKVFTDDKFWLRKIQVVPINDSSQRRSLEQFRQAMVQNNTLGADLLDYAKLFTSDSFVSLLDYAEKTRERVEQQESLRRQHEQSISQQNNQAMLQKAEMELQHEKDENQKNRARDVHVAEIRSVAQISDNNLDKSYIAEVERVASRNMKQQQHADNMMIKQREVTRKEDFDKQQAMIAMAKANNQLEELNLKRKRIEADKYIAEINKN